MSDVASSPTARSNYEVAITTSVGAGVVLALVGVAVGLRMALKATVAHCPNGQYFPEGTTDFRCYGHLHAGDGTAITVVSAMLGILIVLVGLLSVAEVRVRQDRAQAAALADPGGSSVRDEEGAA